MDFTVTPDALNWILLYGRLPELFFAEHAPDMPFRPHFKFKTGTVKGVGPIAYKFGYHYDISGLKTRINDPSFFQLNLWVMNQYRTINRGLHDPEFFPAVVGIELWRDNPAIVNESRAVLVSFNNRTLDGIPFLPDKMPQGSILVLSNGKIEAAIPTRQFRPGDDRAQFQFHDLATYLQAAEECSKFSDNAAAPVTS